MAFVFLLLLVTGLLDLPLGVYGHQGCAWVWALGAGVGELAGGPGEGIRAGVGDGRDAGGGGVWAIRVWPRRWWLWLWVPAVAIVVAGVFVTPYVIDPLFNRFEPMAKADPALVGQLERVVARGGLAIPPERMFVMEASAKSTELNAYVTGFGASKRVVVWDTTIAKSTPDEIAFIFAHEMGHYALGHVAMGVALTCAALLPFFWLGDWRNAGIAAAVWRGVGNWVAGRLGLRWWCWRWFSRCWRRLAEPVANGFSRMIEHNADVYGQEAVHGIVADPQAVGRRSVPGAGRGVAGRPDAASGV